MKLIILLCKLFGYSIFKKDYTYNIVKTHAIKRIGERANYRYLLGVCSEVIQKYGSDAVHFDYMHKDDEDVYAKKWNNYIWVFDKEDNALVTLYQSNKIADVFIERSGRVIENCVISSGVKESKYKSLSKKTIKWIKSKKYK
jgi:nuclear transport factor 2 (NTF2) superfamily protein